MSDPSNNTNTDTPVAQPWHTAYPTPKSTPPSVSKEEVLTWLREGRQVGRDFVLVDVRRTDREVRAVFDSS